MSSSAKFSSRRDSIDDAMVGGLRRGDLDPKGAVKDGPTEPCGATMTFVIAGGAFHL